MASRVETVENPTFAWNDFSRKNKKAGLTGMVLLHDEAEFGLAALESIRPFFDELLVVYNDCSDGTDEIVADFAARNPKLVRAFHYVPKLVPLGSDEHRRTPANSVHSIVHYFNFILSKATYQVRCMWAGDQVAIPNKFGPVVEGLRSLKPGTREWWRSPWGIGYWWYLGVNLWRENGQIYVPATRPIIGLVQDHAFFPAGRMLVYKRWSYSEYLFKRVLLHQNVGYLFYHLKGMKKDRGIGKYKLTENPNSSYRNFVENKWTNPELWTFDELKQREPAVRELPAPEELGIDAGLDNSPAAQGDSHPIML